MDDNILSLRSMSSLFGLLPLSFRFYEKVLSLSLILFVPTPFYLSLCVHLSIPLLSLLRPLFLYTINLIYLYLKSLILSFDHLPPLLFYIINPSRLELDIVAPGKVLIEILNSSLSAYLSSSVILISAHNFDSFVSFCSPEDYFSEFFFS